jgi:5'-3' exonuclease
MRFIFTILVSDQVTLENTMSNTVMDVQGVIDKFGVSPEQIIDYLALMGDSADNIPGVPKVGPKTAAKWLAQYQTLENLIANASSIIVRVKGVCDTKEVFCKLFDQVLKPNNSSCSCNNCLSSGMQRRSSI